MLSIVNAAEMQFRHEFEAREREHALLASIRERRAAQRSLGAMDVAVAAPRVAVTQPRLAAEPTARAAWPRPIGVDACSGAACAVA